MESLALEAPRQAMAKLSVLVFTLTGIERDCMLTTLSITDLIVEFEYLTVDLKLS